MNKRPDPLKAKRQIRRVPLPTAEQIAQAAVLSDLSRLPNRFEVLRCLGEGGMARVYEVRCSRFGQHFALKVIRPGVPQLEQVVERLKREARLLRRLDHPNCVQLIEWNRTKDGGLYLLMELAAGKPLVEHLGRPMPVARALEITRQLLSALEHAHRGGIVHRDVKPGNVMVLDTASGLPLVKLFDFGLAKQMGSASPFTPATQPARPPRERILSSAFVVGSPTYLAPELVLGQPADFRCDLYSVGVMLFYLLTGRKPFTAEDFYGVLRSKVQQDAPRLGDFAPDTFSEALDQTVARAMARKPEDRFRSTDEFLHAIVCIQRSAGRGLAVEPHKPLSGRLSKVITGLTALLQRPKTNSRAA